MIESYDINDYLKNDKELQKAVIRELFKEISTQQDKIDAYKMSENEANEIIAELQAYKDVNEDFKTAYAELGAENEQLKKDIRTEKIYSSQIEELEESLNHLKQDNERLKRDKIGLHSEIKQLEQENYGLNQELLGYKKGVQASEIIELKQTLQEIKAIAECVIDNDNSLKTDHCFGYCDECSSFKHCKLYPYWQITHLITKAEEE